jgi:hypothetical protein
MYTSSSISLLRKAVLTSLCLINYPLTITHAISARASIRDIIDIYIWSKSISFCWRKSLTIHLFLNIIWDLNSGPSNSFSLVTFILKIYLSLIAFLPFDRLTKIYILFLIIELYSRYIIFSYLLILEDCNIFWSV